MEDVKSLYEVRPIKPIVIPEKGVSMRRPASLLLTKEEVKEFMQFGPVYRRINNDVVKVTLNNLDEIHGDQENEKPVEVKDDVLINSKPVEPVAAPTPVVEAPKTVPEEVKSKEIVEKAELKDTVKVVEVNKEESKVEEKKEPETAPVNIMEKVDEKKMEEAKEKVAEDLAPVLDKAIEAQKKEEEKPEAHKVEEKKEEPKEEKKEEPVKETSKPEENNKPQIQINTKNNHGFHDKK